MVTGTGPLGCVPSELALRSQNGECNPELQQAGDLFNPQLVTALNELNKQYGSDVFVTANAFKMHSDFLNNPQDFGKKFIYIYIYMYVMFQKFSAGINQSNNFWFTGFVTSKEACCGQGPYNGLGLCNQFSNLCPNRDTYAFWDAFHPTERATRLIASQFMTGSTEYMNPMNLSTILAMDARN